MSKKRHLRSDLLAVCLLAGAMIAFALSQGMVMSSGVGAGGAWERYRGYRIWGEVATAWSEPELLDGDFGVFAGGLILTTLMVVASPFVVPVLARSRMLWWVAVVISAMAVVGVVGVLGLWLVRLRGDPDWQPGPGLVAFLASPLLNFIGLLCVRRHPFQAPSGS